MKFWLLYLVQSILPVILLVGVCLYFGVHPLAILAMLLIWIVTTIPICIRDYVKDFQNFSTNWTNITELMTRHRGNAVLQSILLIVFLLVMFLLIIVSFIWTYHSVSTLLAVILYCVILLIGAGISYTIYRKKSALSTKRSENKIESGTEIGHSLEFDFVVPPPHRLVGL